MTRRVFITGTDTGVGKTFVARALILALRARGANVAAVKPIETGCASVDGELVGADAEALSATGGIRFAAPLAPLAAAEAEGVTIDLARLDAAVAAAEQQAAGGVVVIEGAGGLLVPVCDGVSMADLAARWNCALVIVARAGLGTINHTLLTVEAARARGLRIAGIVLNDAQSGNSDPSRAANGALIERCGGVAVVAAIGHSARSEHAAAAGALDKLAAKLLA